MIYLTTGLPGHGKTLLMISRLRSWNTQKSDIDKLNSNRKIYICGIDHLKVKKLENLDIEFIKYDDVKLWNKEDSHIVDGSVIVVDEAQKIFPQRIKGSAPSYITDLSEHRHRGLDFYFITQDTRLLDAWSRRLTGSHTHVKRVFGTTLQINFTWDKAITDTSDRRELKYSTKSYTFLNKELFSYYESTSLNTHDKKLPISIKLAILFFIFVLIIIIYFIFFNDKQIISDGVYNTKNTIKTDQVDRSGVLISSNYKSVISSDDSANSPLKYLGGYIYLQEYEGSTIKLISEYQGNTMILDNKYLNRFNISYEYINSCMVILKHKNKSYYTQCKKEKVNVNKSRYKASHQIRDKINQIDLIK